MSTQNTKKLSDTLVIPVLTGLIDAIGMYGAYGNNKNGDNMMEKYPWMTCAAVTGASSLAVESLTNYGLDSYVPDTTGDLTQKAKMAYEPVICGVANFATAKYIDVPGRSGFGTFAIGAGSNVGAYYANGALYAKKYT